MSRRSIRGRALAISVAVSSLLVTSVGVGAMSAGAADVTPAAPVPTAAKSPLSNPDAKLSAQLKKTGAQAVFVQFAGNGAAEVSQQSLAAGKSKAQAKADSNARKAAVESTSDAVAATAQTADAGAKVLFEATNAVPGVAIDVNNTAALDAVAARPDVVKISPLRTHTVDNASVAQLTKVLQAWQNLGVTGDGVKVGVIDTGIDYTHKDFGGVGTPEAYQAALATSDSGAAWTPTAKVVGGYDFVGNDYNADPDAGAAYQPVPHPDPDPLDCNNHGTHVSGTTAGYGVTADGNTYTGDYTKLTGADLDAMKIGPGMAPKASLYGLKVFGCEGSTNVVIEAMNWALDPNGDGDFSDHLDIVNLSLGSDYGPADDPENATVDELAENGVLPVIAMGNGGDLTDIGGSPGNAVRSLAVASSIDAAEYQDAIKVDAPPELAGNYAGQNSVAYDWANEPPVTGTVVPLSDPTNLDGCRPLNAADAAAVKGKVAWLEWDDNDATRRCGSAGRSANIVAAGGIGALFTSGVNAFPAGITGSAVIPVFQLTKTSTDTLRPAAVAGTLVVTFDGSLALSVKFNDPSQVDEVSSFSSRGTHGAPGVVKPDVTAPGQTLLSAGMGTGDGGLVESGTSMATPTTAGISALVKKLHPTWTPEQLKAAVMNTAGNDLFADANQSGPKYGPARVGAGRVDASSATTTTVLAYSKTTPGAVSVSFGAVEAPATQGVVTKTQSVTVQNTGTAPTVATLQYQGIVKQPGVSYTVSPTAVSIPAKGSVTVKVTMTVQTASLRKTLDPTMDATQTNPYFGVDEARQYIADASGRLLVKPTGKTALRVPVYGAAKPVSTTKSVATVLTGGQPAISLVGAGFKQGSGSTNFTSKVSVLDLGYKSDKLPQCTGAETDGCVYNKTSASGDLRYVGASAVPDSTGSKAAGLGWFGIATFGNWATIGNSTVPFVDIDVNADQQPDYEVYVQHIADTDLYESWLVDYNTGELLGLLPANALTGDVDSNIFDTNVLLLPFDPAAIGLTDAKSSYPISYTVGVLDGLTGNNIDQTPWIPFDVASPAVQTASPLYVDQNGTAIPYTLGANPSTAASQLAVKVDAKTKARTVKALVLHLNGKTGQKAEVVKLKG